MKRIHILIAAVIAATSINAQAQQPRTGAGSASWPLPYQEKRVKSSAEAEDCCKPEAKVALACTDCKTATEKSGEDKKGIMAWFKPDSMHGCAGCKGEVTYKKHGTNKDTGSPEYRHVCSKCGPDSAFTCSTHSKHAK